MPGGTGKCISFPLNLPLPLLGIFNAKVLTSDDMELPWSQELSYKASFCHCAKSSL